MRCHGVYNPLPSFFLLNEYRYSSVQWIFFYQTFIDEGMRDFDQVTAYLKANGIRMEGE